MPKKKSKLSLLIFSGALILLGAVACNRKTFVSPEDLPVKTVELGPLDPQLAAQGRMLFVTRCIMCHDIHERLTGPPISGLTKQRPPEWIMNMILEPEGMVQVDPAARELQAEYKTQMPDLNLTLEQARSILEYFRQIDSQGP